CQPSCRSARARGRARRRKGRRAKRTGSGGTRSSGVIWTDEPLSQRQHESGARAMAHTQLASPPLTPGYELPPVPRAPLAERLSWALYDFANTIFSMNVATLYFAVWLVSDLGVSNTPYAAANALASLLVVVSIPFLGALSDARRRRKAWVVGFTV